MGFEPRAFLCSSDSKELPAMQEIWIQSLGQEDPLEKRVATHSSILAIENPMDRGAWRGYSPWGLKESDMNERLTHYET